MIQSMTGFVEKKFSYKTFTIKISIKTLNHRFFDWNCRGNQIREIENHLRQLCQKAIHRGRIEVYLDVDFSDPTRWEISINEELFSQILSSIDSISSRIHKNLNFSIDNFFSIPHVADIKRREFSADEMEFVERSFMKVMEGLFKARRREGRELKKEILLHLQKIRGSVRKMDLMAKSQPKLIQKKLKERLKDLGKNSEVSEEKFLEEAAFIAQRYDLAEEMERLRSHIGYFEELLSSQIPDPVGKKLDFVAQELFREANTINSKAQDIRIIRESLSVKNELESIRQQVQNLE